MEFFKAYLIEFNFNIFCGAPDDISRRTDVPRRIGWEPLVYNLDLSLVHFITKIPLCYQHAVINRLLVMLHSFLEISASTPGAADILLLHLGGY